MNDTPRQGETPDGSTVQSHIPFAMIPRWVVQKASTSAVNVYCALATFADGDGICYPRRVTIAERAGVSVETVKRGLAELEGIGALTRAPKWVDGRQTSNDYTIGLPDPDGAQERIEGGTPFGPVGVTGDPPELDHRTKPGKNLELPPITPPADTWSVDRKRVGPLEDATSRWILSAWNEKTGQSLSARTTLAKIVMRLREHPELSADDHADIIERTLHGNQWWKGAPTPSIIYGNDAQFERCVAQGAQQAPAERAYDLALAAIEEARRTA